MGCCDSKGSRKKPVSNPNDLLNNIGAEIAMCTDNVNYFKLTITKIRLTTTTKWEKF